jgi:FMN phosphatase YigB (HAD superfamily)
MVAQGMTRLDAGRVLGVSGVMVGRWANPELDEKAKQSSSKWREENTEIHREMVASWQDRNTERLRKSRKEYTQKNHQKIKLCRSEYHAKNRESRNAKSREYRDANRQYMRQLWSRYAKNNPDKNAAKGAKYRAMKALVPQPHSIIEKMMIDNYYEDAKRLTRETGISHHVDHIWPISKGGPHLPWNLRVIPASENSAKSARIGDDWRNQ